jgi:hypothetical protein
MKYTWILTPDLTGIDQNNIQEYSCYDDKCLISTFYIDEICDFLESLRVKPFNYIQTETYQYKILFELDEDYYEEIRDKLIQFKTGRFITTSIYDFRDNKWIKDYKTTK